MADKYDVSKRAVTKLAKRENWAKRIQEIDRKAQESMDKKMTESLEQMTERHIKIAKLVQKKALEALKSMPVSSAMDAIRALDIAVKQERLIRGEPTDRNAVSVEEVIRREYDRWLVGDPTQDPDSQETTDADDQCTAEN